MCTNKEKWNNYKDPTRNGTRNVREDDKTIDDNNIIRPSIKTFRAKKTFYTLLIPAKFGSVSRYRFDDIRYQSSPVELALLRSLKSSIFLLAGFWILYLVERQEQMISTIAKETMLKRARQQILIVDIFSVHNNNNSLLDVRRRALYDVANN
jgi:hypothetical protein